MRLLCVVALLAPAAACTRSTAEPAAEAPAVAPAVSPDQMSDSDRPPDPPPEPAGTGDPCVDECLRRRAVEAIAWDAIQYQCRTSCEAAEVPPGGWTSPRL